MNAGDAQTWFIAGAAVLAAAGGGHALLALIDTVRPTWFAPVDDSVRSAMQGTGMRFRGLFPGNAERESMWRFWLGFNVSHGLGALTFGLLCLLIATYDFGLIARIDGLRPLIIAISAAYFAVALRYWFYPVMALTGFATAAFVVSAVLAG